MSPTVFSNFGSMKIDNKPKTPKDSFSIQQKVELLSQKINQKLAMSRSRSGGETKIQRPSQQVDVNIVNLKPEPSSPSPQKRLNEDSELPPRISQPRQRNLQQSASPTKKKLDSSHDVSREDLQKPPISPLNGGRSFKQFLSKKAFDQSFSGSKKSGSSPGLPDELY
jgi:hypothetical protein